MNKENIKRHIDAIIENTFAVLKEVYDNQKEGANNQHPNSEKSRIIFPQYSKKRKTQAGETRLSEQELRFIFVEQFNKYCDKHSELNWFYSVETPTKEAYSGFSKQGTPKEDEDGRSGAIDLTLHNEKFERIALIEFKALNPDAAYFEKDFVKLSEEPEGLTYFIMYVKNHNQGTIKSLSSKINKKSQNTKFICYDLTSGKMIQDEIEG